MPSRATERVNFGKIKEIIAPPNLIELQTSSYKEFLQAEIPQSKRKNLGMQAVFTEVFPIESYDGKVVLDFHSYEIGEPKVDWLECLREGLTYGAPLYVTFLLKDEKGSKEEKVFMGELDNEENRHLEPLHWSEYATLIPIVIAIILIGKAEG